MLKLFTCKADRTIEKILLLVIIMVTISSCKQENNRYIIEQHTINEAVYASGEILPEQYHFLKSNKPTSVLQILVKEGDIVSAGDILVLTGNSDETDKIRLASDQVAIAKVNTGEGSAILKEIQSKIDIASKQHELDKVNAERYRKLSVSNAVPRKDMEDKLLVAERSLSELNALREQYTATKNQLKNQLMTAELQLANISHQYAGNTLRSNISGKVYSILKRQGEIVNSDTPVLMVGTDNRFKLELSIDERDISKIRIGQSVYFETNTYPDRQFEAMITKIDPIMQKQSRYFKVEASVAQPTFFYPQSSVEASVIIRENVKVLMIPLNYLHNGDSVLVLSEPEMCMIPVQTGIRIHDMIEITGVEKGTVIIKPAHQ